MHDDTPDDRDFRRLGLRWTIGDVTPRGFEALRLSVWGASRLFGGDAAYVICVHDLPLATARERAGSLPDGVHWRETGPEDVPDFVREHMADNESRNMLWRLAPLHVFHERYELALDNTCVLWALPTAVREWLRGEAGHCLLAADTCRGVGQFSDVCSPEPRNTGIRGLPPGFDYASALQSVLAAHPARMVSGEDEQGLQIAALESFGAPLVVSTDEVAICSPFPRHVLHLGTHGAQFVGLNARDLPSSHEGRRAVEWIAEHWDRHRAEVERRVFDQRAGTTAGVRSPAGTRPARFAKPR